MVDHWEEVVLRVDTASVGLKLIGSLDTAGDWSVSIEFLLHLVSTREGVVVGGVVLLVLNSPAFVLAGLANWAWWPGAVLALVDGRAAEGLGVVGHVLLARGVWCHNRGKSIGSQGQMRGVLASKWNLVTGDKKQIYDLARSSYLAVKTTADTGSHDMIHTENFMLIDQKKQIRGFYDGTDPKAIETLLDDIKVLKASFND